MDGGGNMSENRKDWIDILKGIGMLLVVLGHAHIPEVFNKYILSLIIANV